MDFRVLRQTPISHLNCFHSLCKGPFVNLRQFSLVIYSHHLRPLAHRPPSPLSFRLCLFTWFLHVLLIQARFFHLHGVFTCFIQAPSFHLHVFFTCFIQAPFFHLQVFLHVSYRPPFFIYMVFTGFQT